MCLMVYLGTDAPVEGFSNPEIGVFGLEPEPVPHPAALAAKRYVYGVRERGEGMWFCSCDLEDATHTEPGDWDDEDRSVTDGVYARLAVLLRAALAADPAPLLFSCELWSETGEEVHAEPLHTATLSPSEITPGRGVFNGFATEPDWNPPTVIRLKPCHREGRPT